MKANHNGTTNTTDDTRTNAKRQVTGRVSNRRVRSVVVMNPDSRPFARFAATTLIGAENMKTFLAAFAVVAALSSGVNAQSTYERPANEPTVEASIRSQNDVRIAAEVEGVLTLFPVREGDRVTQGQVLATIDDRQAKAAVDVARISHEAARERASDNWRPTRKSPMPSPRSKSARRSSNTTAPTCKSRSRKRIRSSPARKPT
jgi:multidrug efflux pump subunit AcrA (membrane-fusion protein)